ncbi:MAG TPA: formyltransferase family protein [Blastocatellia bacterium]|nr:formyltransferase family protein [Blastocatellia bacterium]
MIWENNKLRVIVLTHGYAESLIDNLLKLDGVEVAGVFIETEINRRITGLREKLRRSIRYEGYLATALKGVRMVAGRNDTSAGAADQILENQKALSAFAERLDAPVYFLSNYHTAESIELMRSTDADLGVVWGTNILKESVFKIPRLGSINIHQGRAPYYRGGPPVFWELYNDESEIGITVHFVEPAVDTGKIILQEALPLSYDYSYGLNFEAFIADYRAQMTDPCVRLMIEAVRMIADSTVEPKPQDITLGKRYRLPVKREKDELRRRLKRRLRELNSLSDVGPEMNSQTGPNISRTT